MKENAFVVVPHQDDEINLVGNCISYLLKKYSVHVIYSSIEIYPERAVIRKKEALQSCSLLGIAKNQIYFLDYPDTPNGKGEHFFQENRNDIIGNLEELIDKYRPSIILGTDFDFHSDHRMISIALESAVANVVKKYHQTYCPVVLKGFCYETAYYGVRDYFNSKNGRTVPTSEILSNPSYIWENRISLPNIEAEKYIWRRKAYKALDAHKSQFAILMAESVLNRDNVFWRRRTDNLLLSEDCEICCSSGDARKLNDFMILDTNDILTEDPRRIDYSRAVWKPDEKDGNPTITIQFSQEVYVKKIVLHGNVQNKEEIMTCGCITINNLKYEVSSIQPYGRNTSVEIKQGSVQEIVLNFSSDVELSEIEIFSNDGNQSEPILAHENQSTSSKKKEYFKLGKLIFRMKYFYVKVKKRIWYEKNKGWLEA